MLYQPNGSTYFYHKSARKIVAMFGSLFANINMQTYDSAGIPQKSIRVPIVYASKQHYVARMRENSLSKNIKTNITLPSISFSLESLTYDPSRQLNALNYKTVNNNKRWTPVPYIYNFSLTVHANKTEDGLQIIEQIMPWFTPELNVAVKMVDETIDVPVALNSVTFEDNQEEGFDNNRLIQWNLEFEAKGLFYKPSNTPQKINRVVIDFHNDKDFSLPVEFGSISESGGIFTIAFTKAFI